MAHGFAYLVAVMDWFSRFVLSWSLSVRMELDLLCGRPAAVAAAGAAGNLQQRSRFAVFTSEKFTGELETRGVAVSMDGRGRCLDNIFIERLWRSLKYEEVYLKDYSVVAEARAGIGRYFRFYNYERLHQSLGYRTPAAVYLTGGQIA